jgi:hypothetical protein
MRFFQPAPLHKERGSLKALRKRISLSGAIGFQLMAHRQSAPFGFYLKQFASMR